MNLIESVRIALRSLAANKLRASLTMLGVIIGVGAVIALMSIGRGASAAISSQIQSIGTNLLFVRPGSSQQGGVRGAEGSAGTLTLEDGQALTGIEGVVAIAPEVDSFGQIVYQGNNTNSRVLGVTPEYQDVTNALPASGEFISAANVTAKSLVACLGSAVADTLFAGQDPIGQTVRINNVPLRVICVMQPKGGTGFLSQDNQVFVPLTTAQSRLGRGARFRGGNNIDVLNIKLTDASLGDTVTQQIGDILRERHHITVQDDFTITSQQDILSAAAAVTDTLTIFLGGIAAISLVVGGIGIMNIMLVSVTERTREIGIRKAVGARRRDILMQFLTEATVLSVFGGLIGTLLGWGIATALGNVSLGNTQITPVVDTTAIILAVTFSIAVGLFFGIYPAMRASALKPIEALRYE
ncbi:MAG TPA: ABC transporter permease [Anaerolineae bacterium]|nr:ABC transporter permease [Anaerolineae bacterium]